MVVSYINVEDMDRSVQRSASIEQVVDDGVPASFFTGEDDVDDATFSAGCTSISPGYGIESCFANDPVMEPFGTPFDISVPIQHVEDTVVLV